MAGGSRTRSPNCCGPGIGAPGGRIPTISTSSRSSWTVCPIADGLPPNRRIQSAWLMIATAFCPTRSSPGRKLTAQDRRDAEELEEARAHAGTVELLRLTPSGQRRRYRVDRREVFAGGAALAPHGNVGRIDRKRRVRSLELRVEKAQHEEPVRGRERQRSQQDGVRHGEEGRVGAQPEGENHEGDRRDRAIAPEPAECIADGGHESLDGFARQGLVSAADYPSERAARVRRSSAHENCTSASSASSEECFEGCEMDGVAATDSVDVSQSSSGSSQLVPKHDDKKPRPVRVQLLERRSRFCWGHQLLAPPACKRGARLRVGEDRRRHDVGLGHTLLHFIGVGPHRVRRRTTSRDCWYRGRQSSPILDHHPRRRFSPRSHPRFQPDRLAAGPHRSPARHQRMCPVDRRRAFSRNEGGNRPTAIGDGQPLTRLDAPQILAQVRFQFPNAHGLHDGLSRDVTTIIALCSHISYRSAGFAAVLRLSGSKPGE